MKFKILLGIALSTICLWLFPRVSWADEIGTVETKTSKSPSDPAIRAREYRVRLSRKWIGGYMGC